MSKISEDTNEALNEVEILQNRATRKSSLKVEKHVIWDQITTLITYKWAHFSLMGDALGLIKSTQKNIVWVTSELENNPNITNEIIKFLKNRTRENIKYFNVEERTNIIIGA